MTERFRAGHGCRAFSAQQQAGPAERPGLHIIMSNNVCNHKHTSTHSETNSAIKKATRQNKKATRQNTSACPSQPPEQSAAVATRAACAAVGTARRRSAAQAAMGRLIEESQTLCASTPSSRRTARTARGGHTAAVLAGKRHQDRATSHHPWRQINTTVTAPRAAASPGCRHGDVTVTSPRRRHALELVVHLCKLLPQLLHHALVGPPDAAAGRLQAAAQHVGVRLGWAWE